MLPRLSRPLFNVGAIVIVDGRNMIIRHRRKVRPNGEEKRQWVYDGILLEVNEDRSLGLYSLISCVLEPNIKPIRGLE